MRLAVNVPALGIRRILTMAKHLDKFSSRANTLGVSKSIKLQTLSQECSLFKDGIPLLQAGFSIT